MKKLLVLMLVLGMASLAPAALQISVNGNPEPIDSEIILDAPSGELILDIHGNLAAGEGLNWLYVVSSAAGSIDATQAAIVGGASKINEQVGQGYFTDYFLYYAGLAPTPYGDDSLSAASGIWGDLGALGPILLDGVIFHCEGEGDAIIQLWSSPDQVGWILEDSVIIHQVPEPVTMALLGLGALMLRRRK